jgi:hypothetical protein
MILHMTMRFIASLPQLLRSNFVNLYRLCEGWLQPTQGATYENPDHLHNRRPHAHRLWLGQKNHRRGTPDRRGAGRYSGSLRSYRRIDVQKRIRQQLAQLLLDNADAKTSAIIFAEA